MYRLWRLCSCIRLASFRDVAIDCGTCSTSLPAPASRALRARQLHIDGGIDDDAQTSGSSQAPDWEAKLDQVAGIVQYPGGRHGTALSVSAALAAVFKELEGLREIDVVENVRKGQAGAPSGFNRVQMIQQMGLRREDLAILQGLSAIVKEQHAEANVTNVAPVGRLPWEVVEVDESLGTVHWACDLTEGRAADPWRNAKLSDAAKTYMHSLSCTDASKYSVEKLAEMFNIRQQRVMAILALKKSEIEASAGAVDAELQPLLDENVHFCMEATGAHERHYTVLPSFPNYRGLDVTSILGRLESLVGKALEDITDDDLTPEIAQTALGINQQHRQEEEIATNEEAHMVQEFKQNLDLNLGKFVASISKANRRVHTPCRPPGGWSLVVRPLNSPDDANEAAAIVALPGKATSKRELSEDEIVHLEMQKPKPRRKMA